MVVTDQTHRVTGALTPDSTGDYRPIGSHGGKTAYARDDNAWFLWWNTVAEEWTISAVLGVRGASWWSNDSLIGDDYAPFGGAVGLAEVAEI